MNATEQLTGNSKLDTQDPLNIALGNEGVLTCGRSPTAGLHGLVGTGSLMK